MRISLIIFLFIFSDATWASPSKKSVIWGRVVKTEKMIKNISYQYFIYFEEKGEARAYPLDPQTSEMADLLRKNINKVVRFEGKVKEVTIEIDGPKQQALVFIPEALKPLTLSELAAGPAPELAPVAKSPEPEKKKKKEYIGAIRISDEVANGLVFAGGAFMLGRVLFGQFK